MAFDCDWIVTKQHDLSMVCLRCKRFYRPSLPTPIYIYSAICAAFIEEHKDCL